MQDASFRSSDAVLEYWRGSATLDPQMLSPSPGLGRLPLPERPSRALPDPDTIRRAREQAAGRLDCQRRPIGTVPVLFCPDSRSWHRLKLRLAERSEGACFLHLLSAAPLLKLNW